MRFHFQMLKYITRSIHYRMAKLTAQQRYLFDLRGFLILRNIIPSDELTAAKEAISANLHKFHERKGALRNSRLEAFQGDHVRGRLDCGTMLHWDKPHCEVFRRLLVIPQVIPVLNELCGKGYRLVNFRFLAFFLCYC